MKRWLAAVCLGVSVWATGASADLVFPASFEIVEESPGRALITLTLPLIQGRVLKARPVLPDCVQIEGEAEVRPGAGSVTRVWHGQVDVEGLSGSVFGLSGLLGTSSEVRFVLSTLDGRRYEEVLRPTRAFFAVPAPPSLAELARQSVREGLRRAVRHAGIWFLLAGLVIAGGSWRHLAATLVCCVLGVPVGHVLGAQTPGPGMPMAVSGLAAAAALIVVSARITSDARGASRIGLWVSLAAVTGLLAGWGGGLSVAQEGMSYAEAGWAGGLLLGGWFLGAAAAAGCMGSAWSLLPGSTIPWARRFAGVVAAAWALYQGAGLALVYGPGWLVGADRLWLRVVHAWSSPFAADWAMARLRIPWLSLAVAAAAVWLVVRSRKRPKRVLAAAGVFFLAVFLLPWGTSRVPNPFMVPQAPADAQARRILEPMLSGIYHAVNLGGESEAYDRLAVHVTGDLLTAIYVDSRRRLLGGTREGATVTVREVNILDVGTAQSDSDPDAGYVYPCRWSVTAKVTHWQHTHERRNVYEGDLTLVIEDDRWKIGGVDLHSEEREIVPGSFS